MRIFERWIFWLTILWAQESLFRDQLGESSRIVSMSNTVVLKIFLFSIDFADKKAAYEIVDTYYAENASLSQYILQYNTVPADIDDTKFVAGLGDTTTDQLG